MISFTQLEKIKKTATILVSRFIFILNCSPLLFYTYNFDLDSF